MSKMVFRNYSGIYQLRLETADDLAFVPDLLPARWGATSVRTDTLQCDPAFLDYIGVGGGHIRVEHLKGALKWAFQMLANRSALAESSDVLRLADFDSSHDEGRRLQEAAIHILQELKAEQTDAIDLEQVRAFSAAPPAATSASSG